ncbi:hypothetical protein F4777DRAFT_544907 [Nemania sp. FL0916]|nr:hypothetical protein F4777DRAFT_544907 [Nemania sp. FL0916]
MLSSIGRVVTRGLVSTAFAAPAARAAVFRASTKPHIGALAIYGQGIRGLASAGRSRTAAAPAKRTAAKKPAKKSTKTTAKATKTKTKAKAKPKTKTRAKAKAKAKPKPKTTRRARRPISDEQKSTLERQKLKRLALFTQPKLLATHPWTIFVSEQTAGKGAGGVQLTGAMAALSQEFKRLSTDETGRLKTAAEKNKLANDVTYKKWVESHSPQNIREANNARRLLKKKHNYPKSKGLQVIHDDRAPKRPLTAYMLYAKARLSSGDLGVPAVQAVRDIAKEWKTLTPAERQPYQDLAVAQAETYKKESTAVFGQS